MLENSSSNDKKITLKNDQLHLNYVIENIKSQSDKNIIKLFIKSIDMLSNLVNYRYGKSNIIIIVSKIEFLLKNKIQFSTKDFTR